MEILQASYFNFLVLGSLIPAIFSISVGLFFMRLKNKSPAARSFTWFFIMVTPFFFAYAPASAVYDPIGAYHRYFTVPFVLIAAIYISQILFRYPEFRHKKVARGFLIVQWVVALAASAYFIVKTLDAPKKFHFDGHFWNFDAVDESVVISYFIQLYMVIYLLVGIYKAIITKGIGRWAVLAMILVFFAGTIIPGMTNKSSLEGSLPRVTHQTFVALLSLTAFFVGVMLFMNTTTDRTTFMAKIVGISMVSFLIVMNFVSFFSLADLDQAYDEVRRKSTSLAVRGDPRRPADLRYLVSYSREGGFDSRFKRKGAMINMNLHAVEFKNALLRARLTALPRTTRADFDARLRSLLVSAHPKFKAYAAFIRENIKKVPADHQQPGAAVMARLDKIERRIIWNRNMIGHLKADKFKVRLAKHLKKSKPAFAPMRKAIETYVATSSAEGATLKRGVLLLLKPMPPEGRRIYRRHNNTADIGDDQFVSFMRIDAAAGRVYEAGFSYIAYRKYIHKPALKEFIMTLAIIAFVLVGFRLFFQGTLVRPLNTLLEGVELVNVGDLTVKVPVKVPDEIGFLTESFNMMVATVRDARDNLEAKVEERTRALKETLDEVQALKKQQDGDYFLTSLLIKPLGANHAGDSGDVSVDFFMKQKKTFEFRKWKEEIGGDLNKAHRIKLKGKEHVVFLNADAMGKSMQGAGGILVLGSVFESLIERTQLSSAVQDQFPERWLKNAFLELQKVFESFNGSMLVSLVVGLVEEETGIMYYINAEHPFTVLFRGGRAQFIEDELLFRKLGTSGVEGTIFVRTLQLEPGDVIIAGSDGRDDILMGFDDEGTRIINEDETAFLKHVEAGDGELEKIVSSLSEVGEFTDDLSLVRVGYRASHVVTHDHEVSDQIAELVGKARTLKTNGDLDGAAAELEQALKLDNARATVLFDLMRIRVEQKRFADAAGVAEDYIYLRPGDTEVVYVASVCFRKAGDFQKAADLGERVRLRSPHMLKNLLSLAKTYVQSGHTSRAAMLCDDALALDADNPTATKLKANIAELETQRGTAEV